MCAGAKNRTKKESLAGVKQLESGSARATGVAEADALPISFGQKRSTYTELIQSDKTLALTPTLSPSGGEGGRRPGEGAILGFKGAMRARSSGRSLLGERERARGKEPHPIGGLQ